MSRVIPGIEIFLRRGMMRKKRLGLITNPSGVTGRGVPAWKALKEGGWELAVLFGPEHGLKGEAQDAVPVEDGSFAGIKVYSLFGERLAPEAAMLEGLDALLFDVQDVGCRYYTYLYTLAYSLEACRKAGIKLVVLDRPNPIGAEKVEGSPMPEAYSNFLGGCGLSHRHGFTIGEFAVYARDNYHPGSALEVVRMEGFRRSFHFSESGLPWVSPSPNIPSPETALVYPGTCLFEGTNLSEGRGTTRPFETVGAPWIDGEKLRGCLQSLGVPGALFSSAFFTPSFSKHRERPCQGVTLHVMDREVFRPLYAAVAMLWAIKSLFPADFAWKPDWEGEGRMFVDRLAGGPDLRESLEGGLDPEGTYRRLVEEEGVFLRRRHKCLLYP